ncbi:M15 family metallopeptidase [Agromyces sp. G08B096]|uniref:M15 family metallopeptidase n=1 Tax=Agromyces sp. G08B096 TaxID=3156399 RepID=A0AAU7W7B2_9MICO
MSRTVQASIGHRRAAGARRTAALVATAVCAVVAVAVFGWGPSVVGSVVDAVGGSSGGSGGSAGSDGASWADGAVDASDGELPDGVSVFDDGYPGVTRLEPTLLAALRAAGSAASDEGIEVLVTSGWRSPEYQERLLQDAVSTYGSEEEAARWVATAETSAHVSGEAVDVGSWDAMDWLAEHGAEFGLCRTYANEPWHFEFQPDAPDMGCAELYADPTEDPRLQG